MTSGIERYTKKRGLLNNYTPTYVMSLPPSGLSLPPRKYIQKAIDNPHLVRYSTVIDQRTREKEMSNMNEIEIGDRLDLQRGSMIYRGEGRADAVVTGPNGEDVIKQSGIVMTQQMIDAWVSTKRKQAEAKGVFATVRTSATV